MRLTIENVGTATIAANRRRMSPPDAARAGRVRRALRHRIPLFTEGEADRGEGFEGIGRRRRAIGAFAAGSLDERSGLTSLIAPGVYTSDPTWRSPWCSWRT